MASQEEESGVNTSAGVFPVDHKKFQLITDIGLSDVGPDGESGLDPKSDLKMATSEQSGDSDPQKDPGSVPQRPTQDPQIQAAASSSAAVRFQPKAQSRAAATALSIAQSLWNMDSSKAGDTPSGPPSGAAVLLSSDSCCSIEGEPLGSARDAEWVNVDSAISPQRDAAAVMAEAASVAMAAAAMVDSSTRSSSGGGLAKVHSEPIGMSPRDDKAAKEALIQE